VKEYRASITVNATETFAYIDIDPPEHEGYANQIVAGSFILSGDDTVNTGTNLPVGLSVQSSGRSSYGVGTDGFAMDLLLLAAIPFVTGKGEIRDISKMLDNIYMVDQLVFQDTVRVFVGDIGAVATAKTIKLQVVLKIEEVKLTPALLTEINRRVYS
jgi:hypothetical protein